MSYAIVEAPSVLGLRPTGVERLPAALLEAGLATLVGARRAGAVIPPEYDPDRDPATGMLNSAAIAAYSNGIADVVGGVLDDGETPVVLGGDCSIALGNLLALRRRGRYGLLYVDGHADFYQPEANVNGEAASSVLALATGRGPARLTEFDGQRPLVRDQDVVAIGQRDADEAERYGSQPLPPTIADFDLPAIRRIGAETAARAAIDNLSRSELDGFWIHFDTDVLGDAIMPAVDYRLPGGLTWQELEVILGVAIRSGDAVGIDVTIFNPALDPGGLARSLAETLARSLS